jgi:hypothetical protein
MQNYWTENSWELLKIVAKNAALKSGFHSTVVLENILKTSTMKIATGQFLTKAK